MSQGFIKLLREPAYELIDKDPDAYLLLSQIALRARRYDDNFGAMPLKANQALIGDHKKLKLSRDRYRRAKNRLEKYGIATFQSTNRGTIATLISTTVFDINSDNSAPTSPINQPTILSMKTLKIPPSNHQQETNKPPPNSYQKSIQQPLTRMKECNKETTTTQSAAVVLYKCLEGCTDLSHQQKLSLMKYSEDRVILALEWAKTETINKTLIQALHWHCKEKIPPEPTHSKSSQQQREAWQFNAFLKEQGYHDLHELNLEAIPKNFCHVILDMGKTTVTLGQDIESLLEDFSEAKRKILNRN